MLVQKCFGPLNFLVEKRNFDKNNGQRYFSYQNFFFTRNFGLEINLDKKFQIQKHFDPNNYKSGNILI